MLSGSRSDKYGGRPYTLVEFGDYQCSPCIAYHEKVEELLKVRNKQLAFRFRELPLANIHPLALNAAIVAESSLTDKQFWSVFDTLFSLKGNLGPNSIRSLSGDSAARVAGQRRVQADTDKAKELGVDHTPTFILCLPDGSAYRLATLEQTDNFIK